MNRVGAEQVDTLGDVFRRVLAGDDSAHTKVGAIASHFSHLTAENTTNTAETVEDDVLRLVAARSHVDESGKLVADESRHIIIILFLLVGPFRIQTTDVDTSWSYVFSQDGLCNKQGVLHAHWLAQNAFCTKVLVEDLARTTVHEQRAQQNQFNRFVVPQFANDVDEFIGGFFVFIPNLQRGLKVFTHVSNFMLISI